MTPEERTHMAKHAAWLMHQHLCPCGDDRPPMLDDLARVGAVLPYLEERLKAEERARIAAWLRNLEARSPIINRQFAAQMIEKGVPE